MSKATSLECFGKASNTGQTEPLDKKDSAIKFEDTIPSGFAQGCSLIQNCPPSAEAVRIFDNIVEHASREMTRYLIESFSLYITSNPFRVVGGALTHRTSVLMLSSKPRLNESLILAQNQRWRRA